MTNDNFPILKNSTPSTSEKNINFINEMISNTLFNRKTNGEINLHEFSSKAKTFRSYDKFLDTNELDAEKLKEIKAFMNSVDKLEPIRDGLICWLDGRDGNNNDRTTIWKDRSGNGNDATLVGFDFNENSGWGDGFLKFDGVKTNVEVGVTNKLDWTVSVNVKMSDKGTDEQYIWSQFTSSSTAANRCGLTYRFVDDTSKFAFYHSHGNYRYVMYIGDVYDILDKISTITITRMNTVYYFYVNQNLVATYSNDINELDVDSTLYLGCWGPSGNKKLFSKCDWYDFKKYDRALTPEEVKHNYLYDLSVQYLNKMQFNSNEIETYYDFDPAYDLPHSSIEGCLMVSNGRLVYYNPSGSAPLRIANNKTLDECIVEETEDYIIYSDGVVTAENPIPEGIYFACRVDKHTGEIYYGEGYENLTQPISNRHTQYIKLTNTTDGKVIVECIKTFDTVIWAIGVSWGMFKPNEIITFDWDILSGFDFFDNIGFSSSDVTSTEPPSRSKNGRVTKTIRTDYTGNGSVYIRLRGMQAGQKMVLDLFVSKKHDDLKKVLSKMVPGKVEFKYNKTQRDVSFIFKDQRFQNSSASVVLNYKGNDNVNSGTIEAVNVCKGADWIASRGVNKVFWSNGTETSSGTNGDYNSTELKAITLHRSGMTWNTGSIKKFFIYNTIMNLDVISLERDKNIKLKKYYRSNKNQSSFLGLEDIFTSNNTKEIIDGTIIDTTKTPIEYKEQKNISLTSDSNSYTKNNINIEKSKCGFIKDIRNTGDFKNIPKDTLVVSGKYDEKYQSPTINNARVVDNRRYDFRVGYGNATSNNTRIYNMDNGITRIENITYDFNSISPIFNSANKATTPALNGRICSFSAKVRGDGKVKLALHQVRGSNGTTSVATFSQVYSNGIDWQTIKIENYVINEHVQNMIVVFENSLTWVEIKEIQFILDNSVAPDYVPPNTDGNFIPTYGNSGILGLEQTTKDTDKNENTFARLMFLP